MRMWVEDGESYTDEKAIEKTNEKILKKIKKTLAF